MVPWFCICRATESPAGQADWAWPRGVPVPIPLEALPYTSVHSAPLSSRASGTMQSALWQWGQRENPHVPSGTFSILEPRFRTAELLRIDTVQRILQTTTACSSLTGTSHLAKGRKTSALYGVLVHDLLQHFHQGVYMPQVHITSCSCGHEGLWASALCRRLQVSKKCAATSEHAEG